MQIPVSSKTPVGLVQTALLHQCDEVLRAIWRKVQEICDLERFAVDAHAACFRAGAGDLQFGLLSAGVAPSDLQFPSVPRETQETGCQAEPSTQSTSTQDGPGIRFIKRNLKDCNLQPSSTKIMDEYLQEHSYGPNNEEDDSGHPFRLRARVIGAVGGRFRSVSPVKLRTTPDSEVQAFCDLDQEMYPSRLFRGVHVLAYRDNTYPIVLPTHSRCTFIMQQLLHSLVELVKPLPQKDSLLTRGEYVRAAAADPVPGRFGHGLSETTLTTSESVEAAGEACPHEAGRGGRETDSHTEVEAAPLESAPSQGVFRPLRLAPQTDAPKVVMKPILGGVPTKAQKKTPPPWACTSSVLSQVFSNAASHVGNEGGE